jgi:hypothetical protein
MNVRVTVAETLRMSLTIGLIALMAVIAFQPQRAKASFHAGQPMASGND